MSRYLRLAAVVSALHYTLRVGCVYGLLLCVSVFEHWRTATPGPELPGFLCCGLLTWLYFGLPGCPARVRALTGVDADADRDERDARDDGETAGAAAGAAVNAATTAGENGRRPL